MRPLLNYTLLFVGIVPISLVLSFPTTVRALDLETSVVISICGDGILNPGELCDDGVGFNLGQYGSSTAERQCGSDCQSYGPYCGDSILQVSHEEECDDGNNTSGDLCTAQCKEEVPVPPGGGGAGPRTLGSTPSVSGGILGGIQSRLETKVVLRGKAYPNSIVNILLDGKSIGTVTADSNADFLYTTTDITPGTANLGFWATDKNGITSITTAMVFEVVQSAVTTVANIFIPPSLSLSERRIAPGEFLTISGQTVPLAAVKTLVSGNDESANIQAEANDTGDWALQLDTASLPVGSHSAKALFELSELVKSGYGKSVNFYVGDGEPGDLASPDLNKDGKVNLVDFSIFLTQWGNTEGADADFNYDSKVNLADFSIMLFNWTG